MMLIGSFWKFSWYDWLGEYNCLVKKVSGRRTASYHKIATKWYAITAL